MGILMMLFGKKFLMSQVLLLQHLFLVKTLMKLM